ncbi:MAG: hypothetical protein K2K17_08745 [Lachnospiraceae bacterium]|nr:hypothetical protein [Lachnospiraceae bacterium]
MEDKMGQSMDCELEAGQPVTLVAKRIAAAIGVFLLLALVAVTFVVACIDFDGKEQVFSALLLCDIVIPVFLWVILHFFQKSGIEK